MFNKLESIIKNCSGNILAICLDQKLMDAFKNNNHINLLSIESNNAVSFGTKIKSKKKKLNGSKNISIKKLRKYINKKSVDTLFCNMNEMNEYYKYFIKDSIYVCSGTIYIYFDDSIDLEFIKSRYNRYNVIIEDTKYKNGYMLKIDVSQAKNNWLKDKIYMIHDTLYNLVEIIGNILVG